MTNKKSGIRKNQESLLRAAGKSDAEIEQILSDFKGSTKKAPLDERLKDMTITDIESDMVKVVHRHRGVDGSDEVKVDEMIRKIREQVAARVNELRRRRDEPKRVTIAED